MTARKPPNKPGGLSGEDRALWERMASDVTPLEHAPAPEAAPPEPAPKPKSKPAPQKPPAQKPSAPDTAPDMTLDMTLDRRQIRALKTGRRPIEAELDLHGLFQNQAQAALADFIESAAISGKKAVLVITGKGVRGTGEPGVLRRMTPQWLRSKTLSRYVAGFSPAAQGHGGEGAFYVRLKRPRR